MRSDFVKLVSVTPKAEETIAYCARVSNPVHQDNPEIAKLISYCLKHGHWSIFEQANMIVEISTSRSISSQILRHRSFSFQEFSPNFFSSESMFSHHLCHLADTQNKISARHKIILNRGRKEGHYIRILGNIFLQ